MLFQFLNKWISFLKNDKNIKNGYKNYSKKIIIKFNFLKNNVFVKL